MYEIVKKFSESAFLALKDNNVYFLKKIGLEDSEIYKKLMSLNHKNIARIFELTVVDDEFFAVCEYVNGRTLNEIVEKIGTLDDASVKNIVYDICDGLEAIHSLGVIHRDISPNNIMITDDGTAKIVDFGISRISNNYGSADTQILGTQGFAAPEQYGFKQTSSKADIYSLGVLINYLCTGAMPNEKTVSGEFSEVVIKCTQMDENQRYDTVQEVKYAVERKFRVYSFLRKIPGFRKGIWWHKVIASVYYIIITVFFAFCFVPNDDGLKRNIGFIIFVFFTFYVPVPVICNYNGWLEKFPLTKNRKKSEKVFFKFFTAFISSFVSLIILGLL